MIKVEVVITRQGVVVQRIPCRDTEQAEALRAGWAKYVDPQFQTVEIVECGDKK